MYRVSGERKGRNVRGVVAEERFEGRLPIVTHVVQHLSSGGDEGGGGGEES